MMGCQQERDDDEKRKSEDELMIYEARRSDPRKYRERHFVFELTFYVALFRTFSAILPI
jgi:hypothetical protein